MPNDYITLNVLIDEIDRTLRGGKIEKVAQPDKNQIVLTVRNNSQSYYLPLSCAPELPRIHLSSQKGENPPEAYAFCMLLRKYLEKSLILSAELLNRDRVAAIKCRAKDELYDVSDCTLILEIMKRCGNIILINRDGLVLGSARRGFLDDANRRAFLPGSPYVPPKNDKLSIFDLSGIRALLASPADNADSAAELLYRSIGGISKETAAELQYICGVTDLKPPLSPEHTDALIEALSRFLRLNEWKSPCVSLKADGSLSDFFAVKYASVPANTVEFKTLNQAADAFYTQKAGRDILESKIKTLRAAVKRAAEKTQKKIKGDLEDISRAEKAEDIKKRGSIILNNIYAVQEKQELLRTEDYETGEPVEIALDPSLSPSDNAGAYFKKYAKLKRTEENAKKNLAQNTLRLRYLSSILQSIESAESAGVLREIEAELKEIGLIKETAKPRKTGNGKRQKETKPFYAPLECVVDGFKIYAGRNNSQNETVTFTLAKSRDIWLHTKGYHGAHVVISAEGRQVSGKALDAAGSLAAYYSEARSASKVPVDYTERRNVKKIPGSGKGMVTYTDFKTLLSDPKKDF